MYNRYVPSADGSYRRQIVPGQKSAVQPTQEPKPEPVHAPMSAPAERGSKGILSGLSLDSGDLLVLLILLLVLSEGEDTDPLTILVTLAAFLILQ